MKLVLHGPATRKQGKTFFLLFLLLFKSFERMWHLNGALCSPINDWRCAHVKVLFIFLVYIFLVLIVVVVCCLVFVSANSNLLLLLLRTTLVFFLCKLFLVLRPHQCLEPCDGSPMVILWHFISLPPLCASGCVGTVPVLLWECPAV